MCGIIYAANKLGGDVVPFIIKQFNAQKNRGEDGFGFYLPQEKVMFHNTRLKPVLRKLSEIESPEVLFHHRLPTTTPNVRNSAHPFSTGDYFEDGEFILVHNGNITNAQYLKNKHNALGIKYVSEWKNGSFNDSEALLWDLALYFSGRSQKIESRGSVAFILLEKRNGKNRFLRFARNDDRPLNARLQKIGIFVSSEGPGKEVEPNILFTYDYNTHGVAAKEMEFVSALNVIRGGGYAGYPHYRGKRDSAISRLYLYKDRISDNYRTTRELAYSYMGNNFNFQLAIDSINYRIQALERDKKLFEEQIPTMSYREVQNINHDLIALKGAKAILIKDREESYARK